MGATLVISLALLGAISPLSEDQRVRLETAFDGRDHQEEAFAALLENVSRWTEGVGDAPVRLHPDYDALLKNPDRYRGDLFRIVGAIQQRTALAPPFAEASEWFLRDDSGRPILVYVFTGDTAERQQMPVFRDGQEIMIVGRFYKRVDAVARDGRARSYPAFAGRYPTVIPPAGGTGAAGVRIALPAALVAGLLALFVVLLLVIRRQRRDRPLRRPIQVDGAASPELDAGSELSDDPAEALHQLKQRSELER